MTLDPTNIKAVLFDFDDTLAETLPGRQAAVQHAFVAAGVDSPTADEFLKIFKIGSLTTRNRQ